MDTHNNNHAIVRKALSRNGPGAWVWGDLVPEEVTEALVQAAADDGVVEVRHGARGTELRIAPHHVPRRVREEGTIISAAVAPADRKRLIAAAKAKGLTLSALIRGTLRDAGLL
jgi:hypothetical protein